MDFLKIFKKIGMVEEGHFELTSGLHSALYFEKFRLFERPDIAAFICKELSKNFEQETFDTVAGPTTGGVIVAYEIACQLNKRCIFAEKTKNGREFRRGFKISEGERILIVDDVLTTGGSIQDTISAVQRRKGVITGIGVIVDRSEKTILPVNVPLFSVCKVPIKNWSPSECPLCKEGVELKMRNEIA